MKGQISYTLRQFLGVFLFKHTVNIDKSLCIWYYYIKYIVQKHTCTKIYIMQPKGRLMPYAQREKNNRLMRH